MNIDIRKIIIIVIIAICVLSLAFGIYYQIFVKDDETYLSENMVTGNVETTTVEFDKLFDNEMNYQGYCISGENKIDQTKELVYTNYTLTEIYEGKYDIKVSVPVININHEKIEDINEEISSIFQDKVTSIISNINSENARYTVYTVEYTAYLNENILSVLIKSTLKEGNSAQRIIIQAYTYNLSTNEEIPLSSMLEIRGKNASDVETEIKRTIQEAISQTDNLAALGYSVYERDINSSIYSIENSNNYFLGPNATIYIIYAYGNSNYTSERDIVIIE